MPATRDNCLRADDERRPGCAALRTLIGRTGPLAPADFPGQVAGADD